MRVSPGSAHQTEGATRVTAGDKGTDLLDRHLRTGRPCMAAAGFGRTPQNLQGTRAVMSTASSETQVLQGVGHFLRPSRPHLSVSHSLQPSGLCSSSVTDTPSSPASGRTFAYAAGPLPLMSVQLLLPVSCLCSKASPSQKKLH